MLSRSGWRRFLPGKRRNRREDPVIRAIPISEGVPVLHEEETDPEMPEAYPTQPSYVLHLASPLLDDSKCDFLVVPVILQCKLQSPLENSL
jgi:hypothetical protein